MANIKAGKAALWLGLVTAGVAALAWFLRQPGLSFRKDDEPSLWI